MTKRKIKESRSCNMKSKYREIAELISLLYAHFISNTFTDISVLLIKLVDTRMSCTVNNM